jgi:hypothetical protein
VRPHSVQKRVRVDRLQKERQAKILGRLIRARRHDHGHAGTMIQTKRGCDTEGAAFGLGSSPVRQARGTQRASSPLPWAA